MKKQKFSKEALEAYNALMNLSKEEQQLVFLEVSQPEKQESAKVPQKEKRCCPHCESSHVSRYGKTPKGYQRFICLDCDRTFGEKKRPVWLGSHYPEKVWLEYIRLMNMGASIRTIAQALHINL